MLGWIRREYGIAVREVHLDDTHWRDFPYSAVPDASAQGMGEAPWEFCLRGVDFCLADGFPLPWA